MTRFIVAAVCVIVAACSGRDDLEEPGELALQAPTITAVTTSDGFTQICNGCSAELVITGERLASTMEVVLRPLYWYEPVPATIVHASDREIRARVAMPHGIGTDMLDLVLAGPLGEATRPAAIEVTSLIISPTAQPDGNGTYQSPMLLCDTGIEQARASDFAILLAGEHRCDRVLHLATNIYVVGEGAGITRVVGTGTGTRFQFTDAQPDQSLDYTHVSSLTFEGTIDEASIVVDSGTLDVYGVQDRGGIRVTNGFALYVDGYEFSGPGRAMVLEMRSDVSITNSTIHDCAEAIVIDVLRTSFPTATFLQLASTRIERCGLGLRIGSPAPAAGVEQRVEAFFEDVQLIDNTAGVLILDGHTTMFRTVIRDDETTPMTVDSGIRVENGSLSFVEGEISGHSGIAIDVDTLPTESRSNSTIAYASIVGGQVGVRARGNTYVFFNSATVRDQTESALRLEGPATLVDLGDYYPRGNSLSVVSGFALDDRRTDVTPLTGVIYAPGLVLNGTPYSDQLLQGPLTIGSDLRITSPDARWQF